MANSNHKMKRLESKKSHSWWWDSHISPKNSKWLAENLQVMDQNVNRMLKLIEEDGDSFAKKAEMYYQKRPELVATVEEFYRMYRSLAERYNIVSGELHKTMPSDLQSQSSGISDSGSEVISPLHTPERGSSRRRSSNRAAGFDFFLRSGGGSYDLPKKESDTTSSSGSDSESEDASSGNNFSSPPRAGDGEGLRQRITELEAEILEVKEKLRQAEEENSNALSRVADNGNYEELLGKITWYDEELKVSNERIRVSKEDSLRLKAELDSEQGRVLEFQEHIAGLESNVSDSVKNIKALENELRDAKRKLGDSEEEIGKLRFEIENNLSLEADSDSQANLSSPREFENGQINIKSETNNDGSLETYVVNVVEEQRIQALEEELKIRNDRLRLSEEEISCLKLELKKSETLAVANTDLQVELEAVQKGIEMKQLELEVEKTRILVLQEQVKKLEVNVSDRDHEIERLKLTISKAEENFSRELKKNETLAVANTDLQVELGAVQKGIEMKQLELEVEKTRILDLQEQVKKLEVNVSERDHEIEQLKLTISKAEENFSLEKSQLYEKISVLSESQAQLEEKLKSWEWEARSLKESIKRVEAEKVENQDQHAILEAEMKGEIKKLKTDIAERSSRVEVINKSFDALKLKYDILIAERDQINANVHTITAEVSSRDDHIRQMDEHLHRLHIEHVELISGSERARKLVEELNTRVKELEEETERQRIVIQDGAEEKREAIRQLCFSLEHYRSGYHQLRKAFRVHRRPAVLAL